MKTCPDCKEKDTQIAQLEREKEALWDCLRRSVIHELPTTATMRATVAARDLRATCGVMGVALD